MKKISYTLALIPFLVVPFFVHAQETTSSTATGTQAVATSSLPLTRAQAFTMCSQEAIEKRDTNLAAARSLYNNAMADLLVKRKNSEKEAVAIGDEKEKKEAIKEAVEAYKADVKTIQNTLTQSRKTIWQDFEDNMKACREALDKKEDESTKEDKRGSKESIKKDTTTQKESAVLSTELKKETTTEQKSVKESIFESIKSLFGKE